MIPEKLLPEGINSSSSAKDGSPQINLFDEKTNQSKKTQKEEFKKILPLVYLPFITKLLDKLHKYEIEGNIKNEYGEIHALEAFSMGLVSGDPIRLNSFGFLGRPNFSIPNRRDLKKSTIKWFEEKINSPSFLREILSAQSRNTSILRGEREFYRTRGSFYPERNGWEKARRFNGLNLIAQNLLFEYPDPIPLKISLSDNHHPENVEQFREIIRLNCQKYPEEMKELSSKVLFDEDGKASILFPHFFWLGDSITTWSLHFDVLLEENILNCDQASTLLANAFSESSWASIYLSQQKMTTPDEILAKMNKLAKAITQHPDFKTSVFLDAISNFDSSRSFPNLSSRQEDKKPLIEFIQQIIMDVEKMGILQATQSQLPQEKAKPLKI